MISTEMDFATEALPELQKYGIAELGYETAQFEPYSRREQPDILFWPDSGPNIGVLFFVELRMVSTTRRLPTPSALRERRDLLRNDDTDLRFALATTRSIDRSFLSALLVSNIEVFDEIRSGEDLAGRIIEWSAARVDERKDIQPFLLPIPRLEPPRAAKNFRTDSLKQSEHQQRRVAPENPIRYEDLFWEIFGTASDSRPLQSWFSKLQEYLVEERLEFVDDLP